MFPEDWHDLGVDLSESDFKIPNCMFEHGLRNIEFTNDYFTPFNNNDENRILTILIVYKQYGRIRYPDLLYMVFADEPFFLKFGEYFARSVPVDNNKHVVALFRENYPLFLSVAIQYLYVLNHEHKPPKGLGWIGGIPSYQFRHYPKRLYARMDNFFYVYEKSKLKKIVLSPNQLPGVLRERTNSNIAGIVIPFPDPYVV